MTQPFGEHVLPTRKLAYYPFAQDLGKVLYFQDRDLGPDRIQPLPNFDTAQLDAVACHGLTIRTYAVGELTVRNMTAVALAGVGATNDHAEKLLNMYQPGTEVWRKLGGTGRTPNPIAAILVGRSFWHGALVPDKHAARKIGPTLRAMDNSHYRDSFVDIVTCIAKGLTVKQVAAEFGKTPWWVRDAFFEFNTKLCVSKPELVMIVGGLGLLPPSEKPA